MRWGIDEHALAAAVVADQVHVGVDVHLHVVVDRVGGGGRRRLRRRHEIIVGVDGQGHIRRPRFPRRGRAATAVHSAATRMTTRHAVDRVVFCKRERRDRQTKTTKSQLYLCRGINEENAPANFWRPCAHVGMCVHKKRLLRHKNSGHNLP